MINLANRLMQIEHLCEYLREKYNFYLKDREVCINCSMNDPILTVIACNFIDINRYIILDHVSLAKEPAKLFLHEIKDSCGVGCRLDGEKKCFCSGKCFERAKCAWLRFARGVPYCYLANPLPPAIPKTRPTAESLREKALSLCGERPITIISIG